VNLAGTPRALRPEVGGELYPIAREALVNAYQHGGAGRIDVDLTYAADWFRCVVRDNGCGIAPAVVQRGRQGHWGLTGMRERAQRIGAQLEVRSVVDRGTEVEFRIKGRLAYLRSNRIERVRRWLTQRRSHTPRS
jgi:signal transduction histidine kinase